MNKQDLINKSFELSRRQEEIGKEIERLVYGIKSLPDDKPKLWRPCAENKGVFVVRNFGPILDLKTANLLYNAGIVHETKSIARSALKRMEVTQRLRELADGYKFRYLEQNWMLIYDPKYKKWDCRFASEGVVPGIIYFPTKSQAEAAIAEIGDDLNVLIEVQK